MRLTWIAAALSPRDVAPHQNFMHADRKEPANLLGLLSQHRHGDFRRLRKEAQSIPSESVDLADAQFELELVNEVERSLLSESQAAAADRLIDLLRHSEPDPACLTAVALFTAMALGELDRQPIAAELIAQTLERIGQVAGPDGDLLRAVLEMQLAMRNQDADVDSTANANRALELANSVRPSEVSTFPLSRSVRWPSSRTVHLILEEVAASADQHLANLRGGLLINNEWQRFVRSPPTLLSLRNRAIADDAYGSFVKDQFELVAGSTKQKFRTQDPVESGLCAVLTHYELAGAGPQSRQRRAELGRLRFLRASEFDPEWAYRESLRLFRQGEDREALGLTVRHLRAAGPLRALKLDADQILETRATDGRLRDLDLDVLTAAAPLMTTHEATPAVATLMAIPVGDVVERSGSWSAPSEYLESLWTALAALAAPALRSDEVAQHLLDIGRSLGDGDELLLRAFARAATSFQWNKVGADLRSAWVEWLTADSAAPESIASLLAPQLGVEPEIGDGAVGLERAAALLNRLFRTGQELSPEELDQAESDTLAHLEADRGRAANGQRLVGGVSAADVAAGLALDAGSDLLWGPLAAYLLDPNVSRADKAPALDRIGQSTAEVPASAVAELRAGIRPLLTTAESDPFDPPPLVPFPAALRCAAALGLVPDAELLNLVARLAGSAERQGRVEAARTLGVPVNRRLESDSWAALALQLSHDGEALVRAEAGRALGRLVHSESSLSLAVVGRVAELLDEDGLVIPLLTLNGLEPNDGRAADSAIRRAVERIARSHPAGAVRERAESVIDGWQPS